MSAPQAKTPPFLQTRLLRYFAKLSLGFWSGQTRFIAYVLGLGFIGCLFLKVGADLAVNWWNKYFFDALQSHDANRLFYSIIIVLALAGLCAGIAGLLQYVRMRFQLRWREWLSKTLIKRWMGERRFYQLSILDFVDNPEGRIAEDGRLSIELFVDFTGGVVNAFLAATSFIGVLWFIGGSLTIFGVEIPGYLVVAAVLYSSLTSLAMWLIGRPLVDRVEYKAAGEADFRYEMTRTRENAETIALIGGDDDERANLGASFDELARRWMEVIKRQTRMMFLNGGNNVLAPVIPLLLGAPKYLAGEMTLGDLMQAAAAFTQVQTSLNWLADNSLRLADWFASARRVAALDVAFNKLDGVSDSHGDNTINMGESDDGALHLCNLCITQHDGTVMLADADVVIPRGEKVLVKGDSGSGKSTLIRAIAGLWPWGTGSILRPQKVRTAFMPQRPYLPLGTLRDVIDYPRDEDEPAPTQRIEELLRACGLEHMVKRLDEEDNWTGILSGGEQQRIAFARVLLKRPDLVIMDEPTSALDELSQTRMMDLLSNDLPQSTVVHVAHRPGLERFHDREIYLKREGDEPAHVEETSTASFWGLGRRIFRKPA